MVYQMRNNNIKHIATKFLTKILFDHMFGIFNGSQNAHVFSIMPLLKRTVFFSLRYYSVVVFFFHINLGLFTAKFFAPSMKMNKKQKLFLFQMDGFAFFC